jgi:Skp family chaperone for outer membrane proteins
MKKSLLTLIMALVMALACATSAFAAEELGYVNVERVFRSYPDIQTTMSAKRLKMNSTKRLRNLTTRADASWAKNYPLR